MIQFDRSRYRVMEYQSCGETNYQVEEKTIEGFSCICGGAGIKTFRAAVQVINDMELAHYQAIKHKNSFKQVYP